MHSIFAFIIEGLNPIHLLVLLTIGILLFGKRLPEVGRSLGKGLLEFKKGMKGLEDEISGSVTAHHEPPAASVEPPRPPQRVAPAAPKFEDNAGQITPPKA